MTPDQIRTSCKKYSEILTRKEYEPVRNSEATTKTGKLSHIHWMCIEIKKYYEDPAHIEKAMRWLGFIQGTLNAFGIVEISDLRSDNRKIP